MTRYTGSGSRRPQAVGKGGVTWWPQEFAPQRMSLDLVRRGAS
jgi:hypothetical protein